MRIEKKTYRIKHKIRGSNKNRERHTKLAVLFAILIIIVILSGISYNSMLNQSTTNQKLPISERKAAIVDQLSLTIQNQSFIETITTTLEQCGYDVDYYPGGDVTVEFFRNLPTFGYELLVLRVHSSAAMLQGEEYLEAPVSLFTGENYTESGYVWEQLTDQIVGAAITMPPSKSFFAITPYFVKKSMKGEFQNTLVIMMGCEGLHNTRMAEAFVEKGAKAYISWNGNVKASHTDLATACLIQHLVTRKLTLEQSILETSEQIGPDPVYNSLMIYYPIKAGNQTIED